LKNVFYFSLSFARGEYLWKVELKIKRLLVTLEPAASISVAGKRNVLFFSLAQVSLKKVERALMSAKIKSYDE